MTTQYYGGLRGTLRLPAGITSIAPYTFYEGNFKGDLYIPDGVTVIGEKAFCGCGFNGSLRLPDSLTEIGNEAFSFCTGFRGDLYIPAGVVSVGEKAFKECRCFDGRLIIAGPETEIGPCAFHRCGLDVIEFYADHPGYITCVDSVNEYDMPLTYVYCADCFNGSTGDTDAWTSTYMHDPNEINVTVGETFTVNGAPADSYVYRSTDESVVAIVDGAPVAATKGSAVVSAISMDAPHMAYAANVRVSSIPPETYWIEEIPYLHPGDRHQIKVHVVPEEAEYTVSYDVADENVAEISADGVITAFSTGTTAMEIVISYDGGSFGTGLSLSVVEPVREIAVDCEDTIPVPVGTSVRCSFSVLPEAAFNKEIRLSLIIHEGGSDPARAYVSGSEIVFTAYEPGVSVIRIASADNPEIYRDVTVIGNNNVRDIRLSSAFIGNCELRCIPDISEDIFFVSVNGAPASFEDNPLNADSAYVLTVDGENMVFSLSDNDTVQ